jgi:hypothetical protein
MKKQLLPKLFHHGGTENTENNNKKAFQVSGFEFRQKPVAKQNRQIRDVVEIWSCGNLKLETETP